ncbi:styrene monooxygenase/indole monooxygenase family protein [Metabacillus arenae]|uniref:Styrene monooxygenase n=1 Tax=Metabacillus arenae TaxID=2771434 RepID=A0A926RZB1_9BACI|nr:styrene monooxygenase/indole monooxygenase family protein [Metabacillus arenae]MBD1382921.1 styrene monooxygenase [Metabacillus arenae]
MKKQIGIIGSGTAGLQLAYALKDDFEVTVIHHRSQDEIRNGRIMSTQVHFGSTRARENRFSMPKWEDDHLLNSVHITIGNQKLFVGSLNEPALSVDQRLYYSYSMEDLDKQGVSFRMERVDKENTESLIEEYDLVIDCTGKSGPLFPFPIERDLSPFHFPQRKCITGYFLGIKPNHPLGINVTVLPELGEMFEIPAMTEEGPVTILFIMAIPEKELDAFKGIKDPSEFTNRMKGTTQKYFPDIYHRINNDQFALCDDNAYLQIAITPVIRRSYGMLDDKLVLACGDSVFLNDPITGQGCNLSSYCVEKLASTLLEYKDLPWDSELGKTYWNRTKPFVKQVTEWTNAMTQPLPEHVVQLLLEGAHDQAKADRIAEWFADPRKAHEAFFKTTIKNNS